MAVLQLRKHPQHFSLCNNFTRLLFDPIQGCVLKQGKNPAPSSLRRVLPGFNNTSVSIEKHLEDLQVPAHLSKYMTAFANSLGVFKLYIQFLPVVPVCSPPHLCIELCNSKAVG